MKKWLLWLVGIALVGLIAFVSIAFVRLQLAQADFQQAEDSRNNAAPLALGQTQKLEILPLYEAAGSSDMETGHGVAYLIRTDHATILFDLGYNPDAASPSPLEQNMARLGISREDLDLIVISHRHPDHVGGQNWWMSNTFSLDGTSQPPLGDLPVYIPEAMTYPGSDPTLAAAPTRLAEGVATTGLIGYAQPFPIWLATPKGDEEALAVNVAGQGIVLITGCGHMGLDRLLARAKTVFDVPVVGVVGGLHYGDADAATVQAGIQLLQGLNPMLVALSPHDSGPAVLDAFAQAFPMAYQPIRVGALIAMPQRTAHNN
jgi:7,8-dihydropterin-6-yl-methyl-4-(beta-D-ribofuranosyl)aminobenzene 5'-phosphate synthase